LWKATKKFKQPVTSIPPIWKTDRTWARSSTEKVEVFAEHLVNVFSPPQQQKNDDADIEDFLQAPHQLPYPIKTFSLTEVLLEIKLLNPRKEPGHNLIVGDMLKNLPRKTVVLLTTIYNIMLRLGYYPIQ
jgi:hypothetical protein